MTVVRPLAPALLAGAALVITGPIAQAAPPKAASECFLSANVDGFRAHDDGTVYISVNVRDIWRLDLMHDCQGLTYKNDIGLEHRGAGPWVCAPIEAEVVYRDSGFPQYCPVSGLHHLTPAEREALPKRDIP